ncbi:hypothetical protein HDU67_006075, partial [Dinochytrium kinnereticum]
MNPSPSAYDVGGGSSSRDKYDSSHQPSQLKSVTVKRSQSVDARAGSSMERELLRDFRQPDSSREGSGKRRMSQPVVLTYHPPTGTFKPAEERVSEVIAGQSSSEPPSRMDRVRERRTKRTTKHIGQFLRLNIQLSNGLAFDVTVDKAHTIEYLAHQIEAEYAFRNILYSIGQTEKDEVDPQQKPFEPLEIGQLFDAGMLALGFSDVIGDVLSFNDNVLVINTYG